MKCKDCKRFKPISYAGGENIYPYCNQEYTYEPCCGGECDYPDMYEQKKQNDMPYYNRDMMHCSQDQCKKKDQCYRYWLGQEIKNQDLQYAYYYLPEKPITDGCSYFVNKHYFE